LERKCVVVIEISVKQQRPIFCIKDSGEKLKQGHVYFRNGSTNDVAKDLVTLERIIRKTHYFSENNPHADPTYNKYSKFPPAPYYEFIGRESEINQIYNKLIFHHKNYFLSLTGDGGIGKTSIAYKVAEEIKNKIDSGESEFDDVIWISAKNQRIYFDERREIDREFNSLEDLFNKILNIFFDMAYINNLDYESKWKYVTEALKGTKFFFVLDNLEVFSDDELFKIKDFISQAPDGHKFLITSRHDIRVQEIVEVEKFSEETTNNYIDNVIKELNKLGSEKINRQEIDEKFTEFYELTNGNPLYIKFFISQMYRGRKLSEILERRNVESEKPLKVYCFDSTLNKLNSEEFLVIYSIAVSEDGYLSLNELICITSLDRNLIEHILDDLIAQSIVYREYVKGQKVYLLNSLLKSYLIEEKRIPIGEYNKLLQRYKRIKLFDKEIPEQIAFNFGLKSVINKNEIMSLNMAIALLNNSDEMHDEIDVIYKLYPGNYLVSLYKIINLIRDDKNWNVVYNAINLDFMNASGFIVYEEMRTQLTIWKSMLYLMIGKYDDVIHELENKKNIQSDHQCLISLLRAVAFSYKAFDEYYSQRYTNHDNLRKEANEIFLENIPIFLQKPYFFFIKKNILYNYRKNSRHLKIANPEYSDISPYVNDLHYFRHIQF
jgi:hypothetical protein